MSATTSYEVAIDGGFQAACQRYAHGNGTSQAIAAAAMWAAGVVHGAIVLPALPTAMPFHAHDRFGFYEVGTPYSAPAWIRFSPGHADRWAARRWVIDERRFDAAGREWLRTYLAVTDDFGALVEVTC